MNRLHPTVVHVAPQFFGLTETFIHAFLAHHRTFRPVCLNWGTPVVNRRSFPFPARDLYGFPSRWWGSRERLVAALGQRMGRKRSVPEPGRPRAVLAWCEVVIRKRRPRLMHAHFGPTGWQVLALRQRLGVPVVTSFYGYDTAPSLASEGEEWPRRRTELFALGDLFLVEGPVMRERLVDLGCPPSRVQIQRLGVDLRRLRFRARGEEHGPRVVLFAGRLCEKKGLSYALEAVAEVAAVRRDFEFRIIGEGGERQALQALVDRLRLSEIVRWLGALPYDLYLAELERADLLVVPSVTAADGDTEGGAPTVVLEAQALGLPVLATDHADIPSVTRPGLSAIIVPERDSRSLAQGLEDLLGHPERWGRMGRAGRRFVTEFHDIEGEAAHLEELYMQLCLESAGDRG